MSPQTTASSQRPDPQREALRAVAVMLTEMREALSSNLPGLVDTRPVIGSRCTHHGWSTWLCDAVTRTVIRGVPAAAAASITTYRDGILHTVSATDPRAQQADALQHTLRSGPCVDTTLCGTWSLANDLPHDSRWRQFGIRASRELGWASTVSCPLRAGDLIDDCARGGLNLYAEHAHAFDDTAIQTGLVLGTHIGLVLAAHTHATRSRQLKQALMTNREIGVAMGIVMAHHKLTRDQAFDLLRVASQHTNRKVTDIATEVADTGVVPVGNVPRPRRHRG